MDLAARRREFPALDEPVDGSRLAYLDSAASTLTPAAVIDAVKAALSTMGNPGRGVHTRAELATVSLIDARATVAAALRAWRGTPWGRGPATGASPSEIVFTSGTTASINLVADTWGMQHVGEGDIVIASEAEHHSNLLPWQRVCERTRATLVLARVDDRGCLDLDALRAQVAQHGERIKLVAIAHVSNVLGTIAPIEDITRIAQSVGARVLVDGAQAIAHLDIDVSVLGCDFYVFSGHKVYGVPGAGVLWAKRELLATMPPWQLGGGMVGAVGAQRSTWRDEPARFEAGTPNTPAIVGLSTALVWAREHAARDDEDAVHAALVETIRAAGARVIGEPATSVVSFTWSYHPHDVATIANSEGVALRSGHHCAQLVHQRFGTDASTRASVGCYSGLDDVEQLGRALAQVRRVLGPR